MSYSEFNTEDFIKDKKFRKWILRPNPEMNFFWEKWLLKHPEKEGNVKEAKEIINAFKFKDSPFSEVRENNLWEKIAHSIDVENDSKQRIMSIQNTGVKQKGKIKIWYKLAVIIAIFIASIALYHTTKKDISPEIESQNITKQNPKGQKSKVILPDGTVVNLNSESKLSYNKYFDKDKRDVFLSGEAYFEVAHDSLRPFTVHAGKLATTALGTAFNVKAFDNNPLRVTLIEGSVDVMNFSNAEHIILEPGDQIELNEHNTFEKRKVDEREAILWKDGILYFNKADFKKVIETLERWYDVEFNITNLRDRNLICSGRFKNENLSNVLNTIGFSLGFTYSIENDKVDINFKP